MWCLPPGPLLCRTPSHTWAVGPEGWGGHGESDLRSPREASVQLSQQLYHQGDLAPSPGAPHTRFPSSPSWVRGEPPPRANSDVVSLCLNLFIYFYVKATKRCLLGPESKLPGKWVSAWFPVVREILEACPCTHLHLLMYTRSHMHVHAWARTLTCTYT